MAGSPTKERAEEGYQVTEPTRSCCSELALQEDSGDGGPDLLLQTLSRFSLLLSTDKRADAIERASALCVT